MEILRKENWVDVHTSIHFEVWDKIIFHI